MNKPHGLGYKLVPFVLAAVIGILLSLLHAPEWVGYPIIVVLVPVGCWWMWIR